MVERNRIQQYAEELSKNTVFKTRLIQQMAIDIHLQLTRLKQEWEGKPYNISRAVPHLEKLLKTFFQQKEFWEQKAQKC